MAAGRVPPELWLQVIREASTVPVETYDVRRYDPLPPTGTLDVHSGKVFAVFREVLSTKFAMSLVCRLWNNICADFIYDFIIVRDAAYIPLLVERLAHARLDVCMRVRRLDFVCVAPTRNIRVSGVSYNAKQLARVAAKLICLCPRLQVLSINTTLWKGNNSHFLAKALIQAGALECLEWHSRWDTDIVSVAHLSNSRLPHLRSLVLSSEIHHSTSSANSSEPRDAEDDEDSSVEDHDIPQDDHTDLWNFSSLHTLGSEYDEPRVPVDPIVPNHPSSSRHFIIGRRSYPLLLLRNLNVVPQVYTITFCRKSFGRVCYGGFIFPPTVHTIVFYILELPITRINLPHIERIGLKGMSTPSPEEYDYVFNLFVGGSGTTDDQFPSLNLIRFVDAPLARGLEKRQLQFKLWEHRCRSKGVRLEDERGCSMTPHRL